MIPGNQCSHVLMVRGAVKILSHNIPFDPKHNMRNYNVGLVKCFEFDSK